MDNIRICKICGIGSDVNKFKMKNNKIYAKQCLKCISKKNNEKMRNKESGNYYSEYYKKNIEKFKINDKIRYDKNKEIKKLKEAEEKAKLEALEEKDEKEQIVNEQIV